MKKPNLVCTDFQEHSIVNLNKISSIHQTFKELRFYYKGGWTSWEFNTQKICDEHYTKLKESRATNITNIIKFE